ncbi:MAG: hypothetical protein P0Y64_10965 [Candidatus Sphingomonas colombiensis]|nr:hypothetical protein [Sphingomonas sp.]WEK41925.1 MAG: hypothetical protein P0Y64_10965 [Sphingomonas sp.]
MLFVLLSFARRGGKGQRYGGDGSGRAADHTVVDRQRNRPCRDARAAVAAAGETASGGGGGWGGGGFGGGGGGSGGGGGASGGW